MFYATFNSISVISQQQPTLLMSFVGFTSTRLGLRSDFPRGNSHEKNSQDLVWFEPRTPGIQVIHFTTEPPFLTLSQTCKTWFLHVYSTSLLKTLWEKEKMPVTSTLSFSHSVFYPFRELSAIFIKYKIVICKLFQFGTVLNLSFGKGLSVISPSRTVFSKDLYSRHIKTRASLGKG